MVGVTLKEEITFAEDALRKAKRDLEREERTARLYDDPIDYSPALRRALKIATEKHQKAERKLQRLLKRKGNPMPKRKASPAQLRALAKGRATLKAMRKRGAAPKKKRRRNPGPPARGAVMGRDIPLAQRGLGKRLSTQQKAAKKTLRRYPQTSTQQQGYASNPVYMGYVVATFAPRSERVVFFDGQKWGSHKSALVFGLKDVAVWAAKKYGKPAVVASVNKAPSEIRLALLDS